MFVSGCHAPANQNYGILTEISGYKQQLLQTEIFKIATWQKITQPGARVNIYIEGDGHVLNNCAISNDPTPQNQTMRQIAALDPAPNVVYMARPCQFATTDLLTVCDKKYWTYARYSAPVVQAMDQAIAQIKNNAHTTDIQLIGYSGGATIAILVAAQRNDVARIITIAGNLDLSAMQRHHRSSPLVGSLDPVTVAAKVKHIPQLHFIGTNDRVIPLQVTRNFARAAQLKDSQIVILPKVGHEKGWVKAWPKLLEFVP